jgi:hypothetical protein
MKGATMRYSWWWALLLFTTAGKGLPWCMFCHSVLLLEAGVYISPCSAMPAAEL